MNGVRVALVSLAGVAAVVAFVFRQPLVGAVLIAGVAVHGLGWLYLWRQRSSDPLGERGGD